MNGGKIIRTAKPQKPKSKSKRGRKPSKNSRRKPKRLAGVKKNRFLIANGNSFDNSCQDRSFWASGGRQPLDNEDYSDFE